MDELVNYPADNDPIESWSSELKTYIPALEKGLSQPEAEDIKDGIYVFKITLGSAYLKIAVPGITSLEELAGSILRAFNFDNDHLYEFVYKNRCGITERVVQ